MDRAPDGFALDPRFPTAIPAVEAGLEPRRWFLVATAKVPAPLQVADASASSVRCWDPANDFCEGYVS